MGCCPSFLGGGRKGSASSGAHHKLDDAPDVENGSARDDDDGEAWDDFDAVQSVPEPARRKNLYDGLDDDDSRPPAPVDDGVDPFADLGMAPVIQKVTKHVVPSHLKEVWAADDRPAGGGTSLFAMDSLGIDGAKGSSWDDEGLDLGELNAETRRVAQERRRTAGSMPKGKLNATRLGPDNRD